MGSIKFGSGQFRCYSDDHSPAHVHGFYAEVQVIVALLDVKLTGLIATMR